MRVPFCVKGEYDIVFLKARPYLFTENRIIPESVPKGMFMYEIADAEGDGECFARVRKQILVNFCGTVIGKDAIPEIEEHDWYSPDPGSEEFEGWRCGTMTMYEYLDVTEEEWDEMRLI